MSQRPAPAPGPPSATRGASTAGIWGALWIVYVVWGTTYLAIRVVNETMPPLISAGVRFAVAGAALYAWTVRRGDVEGDRPGPRQWRAAVLVGLGLVVGGNGSVVWAERTIPSSMTALIIALIPLWMALIDRVIVGHRVGAITALGLTMGFGGAALLVWEGGRADIDPVGMAFVVLASISWASGSLYARTAPLPRRPLLGTAMQMLTGGLVLCVLGVLVGELALIRPEQFSIHSLLALGYLVVFGSWIAFSSYVWLLRVARTSLVSTYAYVNPVVAVLLGWLILDESIGLRTLLAGAVVVTAVALIVSAGGARRGGEEPERLELEPAGDPGAGVEILPEQLERAEAVPADPEDRAEPLEPG